MMKSDCHFNMLILLLLCLVQNFCQRDMYAIAAAAVTDITNDHRSLLPQHDSANEARRQNYGESSISDYNLSAQILQLLKAINPLAVSYSSYQYLRGGSRRQIRKSPISSLAPLTSEYQYFYNNISQPDVGEVLFSTSGSLKVGITPVSLISMSSGGSISNGNSSIGTPDALSVFGNLASIGEYKGCLSILIIVSVVLCLEYIFSLIHRGTAESPFEGMVVAIKNEMMIGIFIIY